METPEQPDLEPKEPPPGTPTPTPKIRRSLSSVRRELSEEELASPAVQRLLLDELERLDKENAELCQYRDGYHASDKQIGILQARLAIHKAFEILSAGCLTVGAAALGYAPALWQQQPAGWIAIAFGIVLIAAGIAAKVVAR